MGILEKEEVQKYLDRCNRFFSLENIKKLMSNFGDISDSQISIELKEKMIKRINVELKIFTNKNLKCRKGIVYKLFYQFLQR